MSKSALVILIASATLASIVVSSKGIVFQQAVASDAVNDNVWKTNYSRVKKMRVSIGSKIFTATLYDNATVEKLALMLPVTLDMSELNGNEKLFQLSTPLPIDAANPGMIHAGDLMLWKNNTLVLFYKTFRTSYRYTPIGKLDDPAGLAATLGAGSVTVIFENITEN